MERIGVSARGSPHAYWKEQLRVALNMLPVEVLLGMSVLRTCKGIISTARYSHVRGHTRE